MKFLDTLNKLADGQPVIIRDEGDGWIYFQWRNKVDLEKVLGASGIVFTKPDNKGKKKWEADPCAYGKIEGYSDYSEIKVYDCAVNCTITWLKK